MYVSSPLRRINSIIARKNVPGSGDLEKSLDRALIALDSELSGIRPSDSNGKPGGLILLDSISTIVVPDLQK